MQYKEFLNRVAARSGLPRDRADVATQLVLALLGESIDEMEAGDLVSPSRDRDQPGAVVLSNQIS